MPLLHPGEMDQIVTLQTLSRVRDAYGQREVWTNLTMVAAKCEPIAGGDFLAAGQMQNPVTLQVSIYWIPNLPSDVRVIWEGVTYQTTAPPINVDSKRQSLELMCVEIPK
jgi:SPP1 family predicted phage head-tail adaptor